MSSNPVTMFAITAVKTLHDIKETKKLLLKLKI